MKTNAALFTLLAGLAGCATSPEMEWAKPGGTTALAEQDERQCDYEGRVAAAPMMAHDAFQAGVTAGSLSLECMKVKGWRREPVGGASP